MGGDQRGSQLTVLYIVAMRVAHVHVSDIDVTII